jgi:hypothetical protein
MIDILECMVWLQRSGIRSRTQEILQQKAPSVGWIPSWSAHISPGEVYHIYIGTEEQMQTLCDEQHLTAMLIRFPFERLLQTGMPQTSKRPDPMDGGMMTYHFRTSEEDKALKVLQPKGRR